MSEYTNVRALAERMIRRKGAVLTLTRTAQGAYDPTTSTTAAATVTIYSGSAFRESYSSKEIDGTRILVGDVRLLISPILRDGSGDFPKPAPSTDVLTFGGQDYTVINPESWNFDGESNVGFSVQARGVQ